MLVEAKSVTSQAQSLEEVGFQPGGKRRTSGNRPSLPSKLAWPLCCAYGWEISLGWSLGHRGDGFCRACRDSARVPPAFGKAADQRGDLVLHPGAILSRFDLGSRRKIHIATGVPEK